MERHDAIDSSQLLMLAFSLLCYLKNKLILTGAKLKFSCSPLLGTTNLGTTILTLCYLLLGYFSFGFFFLGVFYFEEKKFGEDEMFLW